MNGRNVPWRKKPTQEIQDTFEDASQLKLYLLQEIGPTSFVFKDEDENKFKLSIGQEVSCSCNPHRKDHCIHTLYVCLKIYKLDKDNPLIWQASYIDSEIADLIRFRYNPNGAQKPKKIEKFLKKSSNPMVQQVNKSTNNRQSLNGDDMCPICHEDLKEEEGTTFCKKECGNNFHIKCSLIWAEHRHKIGDKISCPMCRCDWGARAYENLVKEFQEFESRLILHKGHKCGGCKGTKTKFIKGKLFRCVYCENFELCEKCFQNFEHFEHHRYIMKENINAQWKPAQNRDKSLINPQGKNSLDVFNEIMGYGGLNSNNPLSIMSNNLRGFHRLGENNQESEMSIENFLLSCFPDLNADLDIGYGKPNGLSIVGHDVKKVCSSCHTDKTDVSRIKRLNCSHVMHAHCILESIKNKEFRCPDDGVEFLKGYRSTVVQRENLILNKASEKSEPKVQTQSKVPKKAFEEEKSNRNNTRLEPLGLDIKGKGVSAGETNIEPSTIFNTVDPFIKQKPHSILSKNIFKKPPTHSKANIKNMSKDISLPPLFEIQGTNINNNDQQAPQAVNGLIKKPLMPIHQNTSNSNTNNERQSPLNMQSFKISSTSVRVQPRKTKKVVNQAGVKTLPRNAASLNQVRSAHSERNQEALSQNIEEFEGNTTDYEEIPNENF